MLQRCEMTTFHSHFFITASWATPENCLHTSFLGAEQSNVKSREVKANWGFCAQTVNYSFASSFWSTTCVAAISCFPPEKRNISLPYHIPKVFTLIMECSYTCCAGESAVCVPFLFLFVNVFIYCWNIKKLFLPLAEKSLRIHSRQIHGRDLTQHARNQWAIEGAYGNRMALCTAISCRSSNKYLPAFDDLLLFTDAPLRKKCRCSNLMASVPPFFIVISYCSLFMSIYVFCTSCRRIILCIFTLLNNLLYQISLAKRFRC